VICDLEVTNLHVRAENNRQRSIINPKFWLHGKIQDMWP